MRNSALQFRILYVGKIPHSAFRILYIPGGYRSIFPRRWTAWLANRSRFGIERQTSRSPVPPSIECFGHGTQALKCLEENKNSHDLCNVLNPRTETFKCSIIARSNWSTRLIRKNGNISQFEKYTLPVFIVGNQKKILRYKVDLTIHFRLTCVNLKRLFT